MKTIVDVLIVLGWKAFICKRFCEDLKSKTNLKASRYLTVQEKVAIFLLIISHNESNRIAAEKFQHSGHTIF